MYRTSQFRSLSSRDAAYQEDLLKRRKLALKLFDMSEEVRDLGDRLLFRSGPRSLELYRSSDSLLWTNHELAYVDAPKVAPKLPADAEARALAEREIARLQLDVQYAAVSSINHVEASISEPGSVPRTVSTAVDVNFRFELGGLPCFGPGAKVKLSFGDRGQLAQVVYFWRRPTADRAMACLSSEQALEKFKRDPAFFRLRDTDSMVHVKAVTLGYYALTPSEFQRLYLPAYAIDAEVITRELPSYQFRKYVVAINATPEQAKRMGAVANPAAYSVF